MEKGRVTVAGVSALDLLRIGGSLGITVSVTTESVISTTDSSAQGMGCATAATVTAGMAGRGTPVRSGWELNTNTTEHFSSYTKRLCCQKRCATPKGGEEWRERWRGA